MTTWFEVKNDNKWKIDKIVQIEGPKRLSDTLPAPPIDRRDRLAVKERLIRLKNKCFHERNIHQYWQGDTLYRSAASRSIGSEELFLDLVMVGGIAAIGHELRETFQGWREVETVLLLFSALYSSWRQVVLLWNIWGVCWDTTDKIGIYIVFTCVSYIALGDMVPLMMTSVLMWAYQRLWQVLYQLLPISYGGYKNHWYIPMFLFLSCPSIVSWRFSLLLLTWLPLLSPRKELPSFCFGQV